MKYFSLITCILVLQACAIGALTDSDVGFQPILKPKTQNNNSQTSGANVHSRAQHEVQQSTQPLTDEAVTVHTQSEEALAIEHDVEQQIKQAPQQLNRSGREGEAVQRDMLSDVSAATQTEDVFDAQPIQLAAAGASGAAKTQLSAGDTYLQIGMFRSLAGAEQVRTNARAATQADVSIRSEGVDEHRVLVGPISRDQLAQVKAELAHAGLSYFRYETQ